MQHQNQLPLAVLMHRDHLLICLHLNMKRHGRIMLAISVVTIEPESVHHLVRI
ncbi:hypothetical protein FHR25_002219 [Yokenella regensburgei]|nr:hypothetical protein FHR25_002219 [Yokenella regensburgei]